MFKMLKGAVVFFLPLLFTGIFLSACDDSGVETPTTKTNPDVVAFDSLWIEEGNGNNLCGLNLFNGTTVLRDSASKDCQLIDTNGSGVGFHLRSGDMSDNNLPIGMKTRFHRIYASMTKTQFDSITVLPVARDTILPEQDFTSNDTYGNGAWGYFNAPLTGDQPVYSFYLEGKSLNFHGKNIYGIIQPIFAEDSNPLIPGGYYMTFRVRINFNAKNDFRLTIPVN